MASGNPADTLEMALSILHWYDLDGAVEVQPAKVVGTT